MFLYYCKNCLVCISRKLEQKYVDPLTNKFAAKLNSVVTPIFKKNRMHSIVTVKHAARLGIPWEGSVLRKKGF